MLLSVIIPVFNVEKYIEKCILSVINNDLLIDNYEIIVVDDESPDNSKEIVESLMIVYPDIKLISQKNKGLGGARNTGINNAKGKYLLFLDADDYLKESSLLEVVNFANNNSLDILEFGAKGIKENGDEVYRVSKSTNEILNGYGYLDKIQYMNSACNKLYSLKFLHNNKLRFIERIFIEDFEFNTRAFYYAKRVSGMKNIVGCFVQSPNSITRSNNVARNEKMVFDILNVINITNSFYLKVGRTSEVSKRVLQDRIGFLVVTLLFTMLKFTITKQKREKVLEELIERNLYPVKTKLKDRKKELFKFMANFKFLYNLCRNLKDRL